MQRQLRKIVIGAVALVAVAVAGGAIAATQSSPRQESQAVVNDAAAQLGVKPAELTSALKTALKNRVDEAVQSGRLTQAEANAIKERIDAGDVPLLGLGGPGLHLHRVGPGDELKVAASYLGTTQAALRTSLAKGQTLAQVAKDRGKSVDGLVAALVDAEKQEWAQAVKDGRMTAAQRDAMLAGLKERMTALVNGGPPFGVPPFGDRARVDLGPAF